MPFDSEGNFTRVHNWEEDRQNDIDIVSDRHDEEDDNFANGFNDCLLRDGRAIMTGDLDMGNFKIKRVAKGTVSTDAVNRSQLDDGLKLKEDLANKVTSFDEPTDTQYPSAKLVNDNITKLREDLTTIDFSNITAEAKKVILEIMTPDHEKRSTVSFPFTATKAGWVFGGWSNKANGQVYYNGTQIGAISSDPDGTNSSTFSCFMNTDDKLTLSGSAPQFCNFVPCKGAE